MSWHCSSWAKAQRTGSPARKALLLVLADYANAEGVAYPSRETLAEESEQSIKSVDRGLAELVELGLIIKEPRREAGYQATNQYRLNADLPAQKKGLRGNRLVPEAGRQVDALCPEPDQGDTQGVNQGVKTPPPERQNSPSRASLVTPKQEEQLELGEPARACARDPQDDLFQEWWEAYPQQGHGFSKDRAKLAWRALSPDDRKLAIRAAEHIAPKSRMGRGKPKEPYYWLHDRVFAAIAEERGWTNGPPPAAPKKVFVEEDTEQWEAWAKTRPGKPFPKGQAPGFRSHGWWFDSEWPPGHKNGGRRQDEALQS